MERFQPIASPSSESSSCASHQDYSYAYYEPGAIMCHSNIPTPDEAAGPSGSSSPATTSGGVCSNGSGAPPPPPNSMRALLLKSKERSHKTLPSSRHMYTTRYGTHENIYEDVSDEKHGRLATSEQSLTERGCTKKEFQHILNNHYRVLEELNLSVEELLMSSSPPLSSNDAVVAAKRQQPLAAASIETLSNHLSAIELKDDMRSPVSELVMGEDSGFSGSSSGASYIGSLRNYKTAITRSLRRSSAPNCRSSGTIYGSCRTAKFPHPHESRQGSFYNNSGGGGGGKSCTSGSEKSCSPEAVQKSHKFTLWNKRS